MPPRVRFLEVSDAASCRGAVWIRLAELGRRLAELPPKSEPIYLMRTGDHEAARDLLQAAGRQIELVDPEIGQPGSGRLWEPNPFLMRCVAGLPPGSAIDLACGCGRDAVALAGLGWKVTAVDWLADSLERGMELAERYLSPREADHLCWLDRDLGQNGLPQGTYDLATMFFYLDRDLLKVLPRAIAPGGSILVETFLEEHRRTYGKPRSPKLVLQSNELPSLLSGAEIVSYEEGPSRGRITARGWFRF